MPRLLSLNTYHYRRGGADVLFMDHDRLFKELGWETAVFAMQHPKNEATPWDRYFPSEIELGNDYSWFRKASMAAKIIYSVEARERLRALIDDWRPDIAHLHCVYHHLSPSVLDALRDKGIPCVMTAHDLKLACPAYKMLNRTGVCERCKNGNLLNVVRHRCIHDSAALSALVMVESAAHRAIGIYRKNLDRIVVPSAFYGEKLVEWGWSADKIIHVPNFVEAEKFHPNYDAGMYFVYFGRLASEKGVDTLIRAAVESKVHVKIVGSGPEEATLKQLTDNSPLIEFVGYKSGAELWSLVRGALAVVLPSRWYENAPLSILESYACGKPVIGADIGGISELVLEGKTGFLFKPDVDQELAQRLTECKRLSAETMAQMGKAAREYVMSAFSKDKYVTAMRRVYSELGVG